MDNQKFYFQEIHDINVGPLKDIDIKAEFENDGSPKPIILVGENGSGKTALLSNIVDSFFEIGGEAFTNVNYLNASGGRSFYKIISPLEIHSGMKYMLSYIKYLPCSYFLASGDISKQEAVQLIGDQTALQDFDWEPKLNYKSISKISSKDTEKFFSNNVICYFGSDRYEKPFWLSDVYYQRSNSAHLEISDNFSGVLKNSIVVYDEFEQVLRWLLDVIVDSRVDVIINDKSDVFVRNKSALNPIIQQARINIELILSFILGKNVELRLNNRSIKRSRLSIVDKKTNEILAPTLDSLSTGQLLLFNMFATIIRYADNNDINKSMKLDEITGIVVIDEVEIHLHTTLQREVLPKLFKLFPMVQFIITTHAPMFLLGMSEEYGENGISVYQMPIGQKIDVEQFSEFQTAYRYIQETNTYGNDIEVKITNSLAASHSDLYVITEGKTDWKHLKNALSCLKDSSSDFSDLAQHISFFEYDGGMEMGNIMLCQMCNLFSKLKQDKRIVFIADSDNPETNRKLMDDGKEYKDWKNNVFSFVIPMPSQREKEFNKGGISIEFLYSDKEIKTVCNNNVDGISRRLYISSEFRKTTGVLIADSEYMCVNKSYYTSSFPKIIDDEVVKASDISDPPKNYALSKNRFAESIVNHEKGFDHFGYENFIPIFNILNHILKIGKTN